MNVILAHNNFEIAGGAEVFFHEVGRVLEEQGHQVAYFSAMNDELETPWLDYFPVVASYSKGGMLSRAINFKDMVYNRIAKKMMTRLIDDFKPDIIHVFAVHVKLTPSILDAAHKACVPVVMSCNDYKHICPNYKLYYNGEICEECKKGKFYHATVNRCCHNSVTYSIASTIEGYAHEWLNIYRKNVHTFLFASEFMASKTEEFWGKGAFRSGMLRNPFDARSIAPAEGVGEYALYFGRLIDEKGVSVLLDAVALAQDVPLLVVGDGPELERLKQYAAGRGLNNVQFIGEKWGEDLDRILQSCRFVVVPSLWHENFPYVILQSFAMGKPVIGSNRGGIPELVVHGERGFVYEAKDASALAEAMQILMADGERAKEMGHVAKIYVDTEFNDQRFYERLMQIYNGVLS